MPFLIDAESEGNPVRNSSETLNPAGIILKSNPAAEQQGIISNGVNALETGITSPRRFFRIWPRLFLLLLLQECRE
jgi:hypothetical protein